MKRIIAFALAVIMVIPCVTAFATSPSTTMSVAYIGQQKTFNSGKQQTEAWLQVAADDSLLKATVPLVLVFKTNINGGNATTGPSYKIINQSQGPMVLDSVTIQDEQTAITGHQTMTFLEDTNLSTTNEYSLKFQLQGETTAEDVKKSWVAKTGGTQYDKTYTTKPVIGGTTTSQNYLQIMITLHTTPLTFVTKEAQNGTHEYGVKLFTVIYKISAKGAGAVGDDIAGTGYDIMKGYVE